MRTTIRRSLRVGSRSALGFFAGSGLAEDGSALTLDFLAMNGTLDTRIAFTRAASVGTVYYVGSDGFLKSAVTDEPRFDWDPTTGAPLGLLLEASATNLARRSESLNSAAWIRTASTVTTSTVAPNNQQTSQVVTWTNGSAAEACSVTQSNTVSASTQYAWSTWVKSVSGRRVTLYAQLVGATGTRKTVIDFSVSPPTVSVSSSSGWTNALAPQIQAFNNGWYRVWTSAQTPAGTTSVVLGFENTDAVPASGTNGFEAWGIQLETGFGPSSYVSTGASSSMRPADLVTISGSNFSSWWSSNNPFSIFLDISTTESPTGGHVFRVAEAAASAHGFEVTLSGTSGFPMTVNQNMISGTNASSQITNIANGRCKIGLVVSSARLDHFVNGALRSNVSSPVLPVNAMTRMFVGGNESFVSNATGNFRIRALKYFPAALPEIIMNTITA